jgi:hypothetical protein
MNNTFPIDASVSQAAENVSNLKSAELQNSLDGSEGYFQNRCRGWPGSIDGIALGANQLNSARLDLLSHPIEVQQFPRVGFRNPAIKSKNGGVFFLTGDSVRNWNGG